MSTNDSFKLITLYREAVHEPTASTTGLPRQLTMDYFDALEEKSFDGTEDKIREFFGQDMKEELNDFDVAMHSIPLYRPDNDFTKEASKNYACYGDPFDKKSTDGCYLCFIQVYITSEVMRRIDIHRGKKYGALDNTTEAYDLFFRDLHIAMEEYSKNHTKESLVYCIYQSLSVGDFMIVVRCRSLDYVYQIMETIRRRKFVNISGAGSKKRAAGPDSLILYKTYTIVSIYNLVIQAAPNVDKKEESGNQFILRVVLSNHYRSDEEKINKKFPPNENLHSEDYKQLHGRYNFSVEISEDAFRYLLPTIEKYKLNRSISPKHKLPEKANEKKICKFIKYLLVNNYISQLNERYIAGNGFWEDNGKELKSIAVEPFCALSSRSGYFSKVINKELATLKAVIEKDYKRVQQLNTSRTTIAYNTILLKRLTNTCSAINGYSDSRIYAVIIIRLIKATLNGLEEYLTYFESLYDHSIIEKIDSELNKTLADLNEFSNYILDNSLQSLQAPDYNLESHASVEKLMMSYSAFLQRMIDWYGNTVFVKNIDGLREKYVAIMVPKAEESGLSTRVSFYRWDDRGAACAGEKLLVVNCPSFYALTDFAGALGGLLHELAHHLRFEKRAERNDVIIKYSAGLLLNQFGMDVVEQLRTEVETLQDPVAIRELLDTCFAGSFETYVKSNIEGWADLKLFRLIESIRKCYADLIEAVTYLSFLKQHIDRFVRNADNNLFSNEVIKELWEFYEGFFNVKENEIVKSAETQNKNREALAKMLGYRLFERDKKKIEGEKLESTLGLYDMLYSYIPTGTEENFYSICLRVANFISDLTDKITKTINSQQDTADGRKIARYLGMGYYFVSDYSSIDFMEFAKKSLLRTRNDSLAIWEENLQMYREVASDLFMVKMLGLTPFGYLNFCTRNIPADGELDRVFVSRVSMTLHVMRGVLENVDDIEMHALWTDVFHELCRYIAREIRRFLQREGEFPERELLADFADRMIHYSTLEINNFIVMLDVIDEWSLNLIWFYNNVPDLQFSREMLHCSYLCRNFLQIVSYYRGEVITWSKYLFQDLVNGSRALEELQEELKSSPLWKYCAMVRDSFNESENTEKSAIDAFSMKDMAEFVLNMHYDMIFNSIDKFNNGH